ncbi:HAD family hydrolase [Marinagarivorans algicola]|uniref:HAD family hydrolase n=1 Tax=Marinagarivorans algicola TaxID=1513270 RepID=UPI00373612BE
MKSPTIFFDLDDTLFDYQGAKNAAIIDFCLLLDRSFPSAACAVALWDTLTSTYMEQYHRGELSYAEQQQKRVSRFMGVVLDAYRAQQWYDRYQSVYEQHWRTFNDVLPVLNALKHQGFSQAIITDGPPQQRHKLRQLAIESFFEHMTIPQEVGCPKPDPKIFILAAHKAQQPVTECWYVGNHYQKDFIGALNADFKSVWLNRTGGVSAAQHTQLNNNRGRGWCIQSLDELLPIILHNSSA